MKCVLEEFFQNTVLVNLRPAIPADIPLLMDLEQASPTAAHWTERQYRQAIKPGRDDPQRLVLVAEVASPASAARDSGSGLVGFLVARHTAQEWELENIVVAPTARRKGIGRQLVDALLATSRETNSESLFLEVRESNAVARKLYKRAGFQQISRRKSYYADPPEDAILYRKELP